MLGEGNPDDLTGKKKLKNSKTIRSYTAKFTSVSWSSVLVGLAFTLGCSNIDQYLPSDHFLGPVREIVVNALLSVMNLFFELQRTEYSERDVRHLHLILPQVLTYLYDMYRLRGDFLGQTDEFQGLKLHILLHVPHLIRRFGTPLNWDTETFESSHKVFVIQQWEHGAKRTDDLELNTIRTVSIITS
jgi:hypothetical protein